MKYHNYLIIIVLALFSCEVSLENENDKREHALRKEIEEKFAENSIKLPNIFFVVEPSIDPLFINAFHKEAKKKEWEASIAGVLLTSEDWVEDIDKQTQEIKGRIRTAIVFFKGEEGLCFIFETYQIYQDYQNGEYVGEPRASFHSPSKLIACEKYKHLMLRKVEPIEYDKKAE